MQLLHGLAIPLCRLVVLRHSEHEDEQEKGFVGNTVVLAQPRPEEIQQKLSPSNTETSMYLSVCFNSTCMCKKDVAKHKALEIDPEQYIRCSTYRKKVCPAFAEVELDVEACRAQWPERGVPTAILDAVVGMDTLNTFAPTLDGPAKMRVPTCTLPKDDEGAIETDDDDTTAATERGASSSHPQRTGDDTDDITPGLDAATERVDAAALPLDLPQEFCIGVQEESGGDEVNRTLAFQK